MCAQSTTVKIHLVHHNRSTFEETHAQNLPYKEVYMNGVEMACDCIQHGSLPLAVRDDYGITTASIFSPESSPDCLTRQLTPASVRHPPHTQMPYLPHMQHGITEVAPRCNFFYFNLK
jgi:hypothetical protein